MQARIMRGGFKSRFSGVATSLRLLWTDFKGASSFLGPPTYDVIPIHPYLTFSAMFVPDPVPVRSSLLVPDPDPNQLCKERRRCGQSCSYLFYIKGVTGAL